jgi:hypothetical protein
MLIEVFGLRKLWQLNKKSFRFTPKALIINYVSGSGVETAGGRSRPCPPAGGYESNAKCNKKGSTFVKPFLVAGSGVEPETFGL